MDQNNGGILGKINTPTTSVASGVWSLDSQFEAQSSSIWPLAFPQTTIANSCRFDGSSDYLHKTASGAGNRRTLTISTWFKRSDPGNSRVLMAQGSGGARDMLLIESTDKLQFSRYDSSYVYHLNTNRLFRDPSAWYHVVVEVDTTQATASNRIKLYVNGVQETSFGTETYPSQNFDTDWNSTQQLRVGVDTDGNFEYFGYMCEVSIIDGQALNPTSFGALNPATNIWEPIAYAGTYGTNGFKLDFADSSDLGNDVSGNNNDFTANNLTSVDQSTDTCSNNFATLNSINAASGGTFTLDEGNLRVKGADTIEGYTSSTIGFSQGKWYFECESNFNTQGVIGITFDGDSGQVADDVRSDRYPGNATYSYGYILSNGNKVTNSSSSSYGNSLATGDILGVAIDLDNMKLYFSKNGTFQNSGDPTSGSTGTGAIDLTGSGSTGFCFVTVGDNNNGGYGQIDFNFGSPFFSISSGNSDANGHGNFEYAVPSGYFALNTKNLAEFG